MTPYRDNLAAALDRALPWELEMGRLWYRQAHSIASLLAAVARTSVGQASGVLAALSPLNRWQDNVSDAFGMARDVTARARTTPPNRVKALRILAGETAESVLSGRKVRAFWRNIAEPWNTVAVPVDRHVYRAAVGVHVRPRWAAPRHGEYDLIELACGEAGARCGLTAAEVGSVVWHVARRESGYRTLPFGEGTAALVGVGA